MEVDSGDLNPQLSPAKIKLKEINDQLAEIKLQKLQFGKVSKKMKPKQPRPKTPVKSQLHHPHIEYVIGEVMFSP